LSAIKAFAEIVGCCPICNRPLTPKHRFWVLATAVPGSNSAQEIEKNLNVRAFSLAEINEWDAEKDSIQITIIDCPHSFNVAMLRSLHPFSIFSSSLVESVERLSEAESAEARQLADDGWTGF